MASSTAEGLVVTARAPPIACANISMIGHGRGTGSTSWEREHLARTGAPAPATTGLFTGAAKCDGSSAGWIHQRGRARCSRSQEDARAARQRLQPGTGVLQYNRGMKQVRNDREA